MPVILLTTVLTLSALYVPQPLLPVLAREFAVSREMTALLTTIVFIPLSLAPLFYGYVLEAVSARGMLCVSSLLLGLSTLAMSCVNSFDWLLTWRLLQGILIPALLTSLMTYTSQHANRGDIQRAMAWYIGATIVGGFAGRAVSGLIASLFDWRVSFVVLGITVLLVVVPLWRLPQSGALQLARPRLSLVRDILADRRFLKVYLLVFSLFLVFAAVMNFLPFRLTELTAEADEMRIGLAYTGYMMGLLASLNAIRIQKRCGGPERTMLFSFLVFMMALIIIATPSVAVLLLTMFLFCGSMFLTHATATGFLNRLADTHKGMINGMYVAFYYAGGAVGSYLPGYAYRHWGWTGFTALLSVFALLGIGLAISLALSSDALTEIGDNH